MTNINLISLHKHRTRLAVASLFIVLGISWSASQFAFNHGFGIDPRYAGGSEVGLLYDLNHDISVEVSKLLTFVTFAICFFVPRPNQTSTKQALAELMKLAAIPILVHLVGTLLVNNIGFYSPEIF